MDYSTIVEFVTTVGFPIVMAGLLFWYVTKKDEQHKEEIKTLRDSLDKNSSVLGELKGLISALIGELKK